MDNLPSDLAVEILSIFGVLGSAWLVSNILTTNERTLFDRIFKRYNKINNIYQLLPILQKNSKRLFLFFSDLTTSIKSVVSTNDTAISREMIESILSHEYYKNKIIQVQNEVFKEYNVDYKEVESAIKRFSQDDQVELYVSGVMRMYESVLSCIYPQCPGVEPNREISQAKYLEIIEKITISETKRWIQREGGSTTSGMTYIMDEGMDRDGGRDGKTINRFSSVTSTRLNTASTVTDKTVNGETSNSTISNEAITTNNTALKATSRNNGRGRSNTKVSSVVGNRGGKVKGGTGKSMGKGSVTVDDEIRDSKELQNLIVKELSKYGYDNYLDALVALKTAENYLYYFPNFNTQKLGVASKVKKAYSSNDVQKVSSQELEIILETSEDETLVAVLIFDDLIHEESFTKLVSVSKSGNPIDELNKQFNISYNKVMNLNNTINGNVVVGVRNKVEVVEGMSKDIGKVDGEKVEGDIVVVSEGNDMNSSGGEDNTKDTVLNVRSVENTARNEEDEGGRVEKRDNIEARSNDSKVLNCVTNAVTTKEKNINSVTELGVQEKNNQHHKVVTLWLFREEFTFTPKMQTYPSLVVFKAGSVDTIKSI